MNHLPNEDSRRPEGGDKRSPAAKVDIAKREEQIVALRLRGVSFAEIKRTVGVSKQAATKAFNRALRRQTDKDIQTHHRSELAELEMEQGRMWQLIDAHEDKPMVVIASMNTINRIHIRRAKLLGLDAPAKFDLQAIYGTGQGDVTAARIARQAAIERLSLPDQEKLFELYEKMDRDTATTLEAAAANTAKPALLALETTVNGHGANGHTGPIESENPDESEPEE